MPNPQPVIDLANAFFDSCVLFVASDLGVFKRLAEQDGLDVATLARDLNCSERGLGLLLDACVAEGLLTKNGATYSNAPAARVFLVPGSPADLSGAIRYNRDIYAAWGKLADLVKAGKPVERPQIHLGEDEQRTRTFVMSMHGRAMGIGRSVVPLLDLRGRRRLLDVGGGPGTFSVLIAQAFPEIECTVLDLPAVVKVAAELIAQQGASEHVRVMAGDYHTSEFPGELDAVNFFGMLHQESQDDIRKLAQKAFNALKPGGVVHVMDMMTDATHTSPKFSALFAVTMALTTDNGWVFSSDELKGWLEEAGFVDFEVQPLPLPMPHWLARSRKP
ncbi:MAG TPA: class I SAM-dependent methyltransferase [Candidatus Binatus sp.]|nr:class I SAM-dependent methyltransferase [Candidatus Binatus sp.]